MLQTKDFIYKKDNGIYHITVNWLNKTGLIVKHNGAKKWNDCPHYLFNLSEYSDFDGNIFDFAEYNYKKGLIV